VTVAKVDPFTRLRGLTPARIGLGRAGDGLPTNPLLAFQAAHAEARDAVHAPFHPETIAAALAPLETILVASRAEDRTAYLLRPDLGRRLEAQSAALLTPSGWDLAIVVADGLSAPAAEAHAAPVVRALASRLRALRIAPIVLARMGRVALGDDIGERLSAAMVLVLIGERPGLSAADSLGAYLTFAPRLGRLDAERNCVSNIRPPHGLSHEAAADALTWLVVEGRRRGLTGVGLKDERPGVNALHAPTNKGSR
jgi:ethanolamine ammonia-lyase small subunit